MFDILSLYGIPPKIINAIKLLYTDTISSVQTPDGETDTFPVLTGILQGDTLAPFLFIIVIDYIMRVSVDKISHCGFLLERRLGSRNPATHVTDADFADDIALISSKIEDAQKLLTALESAANCTGLYLNDSKTEFLTLNIDDPLVNIKTLSGTFLKKVFDYTYLGFHISSSEKDYKIRKALTWSACNKLHRIWSSRFLTNKLKVKVLKTCIEPILLYGSETWTLTKKQEKQLDGTYTRLLRRIKNLSWRDHPTKATIYGSLKPISALSRTRRVQFAGHCFRASKEIISSLLLWKPKLVAQRSRKLTFPDVICRDTGLDPRDLSTAMRDRDSWRQRVESIVSTAVEQ